MNRPHPILSVLALFLGLISCLPSGASILCIGADGHIAVESSWAPCSPGADANETLEDPCSAQNCSSCLDIPIHGGTPTVLSQAQTSPSAILGCQAVCVAPVFQKTALSAACLGFDLLARQVQTPPLRC